VSSGTYGAKELVVRVNALGTQEFHDDLLCVSDLGASSLVVPKVSTPQDVLEIDKHLNNAGTPANLGVWVMIETALAVLNVHDIAKASTSTRLTGMVVGPNDLVKEMGAQRTPDRLAIQSHLSWVCTAARAYGLIALDGVYNDFKDDAGFQAECHQGRIMGFDGKTLIHPSQVETCNSAFAPSPDDLAHAHAIIDAFALAENQNKGAIDVGGEMVERLHLEEATQLVALEKAILELAQN
jgi:citrate lyase subunit beta/citryl-CoA lyase